MRSFVVAAAAALGVYAAAAESRQLPDIVREKDGIARVVYWFASKSQNHFEVEVNGRWAAYIAAPRNDGRFFVPFDVELKRGANRVRIHNDGELPEIVKTEVRDFAPRADLETPKWQRMIDEASAKGGGRVVIPAGRHLVCGLVLKSNVELHLEKDAVLEGVYGLENYPVWSLPCSEGTWSAIVMAKDCENIAITGEGTIFGNGSEWPLPLNSGRNNQEGTRARGIFICNSRNVRLADFLLKDASCWGCVLQCVDGLVAERVRIDNHACYNNDGFDIEVRNAVFRDCDVDASDDAFVFKSNNPDFEIANVLITNCIARSHCNAIKFGTASHGPIRHVRIVDCKALPPRRDFIVKQESGPDHATKGKMHWSAREGYGDYPAGIGIAALAVECVDGGEISDVLYENIECEGYMTTIFVRGGTRSGRGCGTRVGDYHLLRDITFRNIRGRSSTPYASSVSGVDGCRAENVTLENVFLECLGAGKERSEKALRTPVPDVSGGYPEITMFRHILPAYGLYVDRTDNLVLKNVKCVLREGTEDLRPPVYVEKGAPTPLEALMPRPVRAERLPGSLKAWRVKEAKVVTGPVPGAPAATADEAYMIEVTPAGCTITAPTAKGVRHARTTLAQLVKLSDRKIQRPEWDNPTVPCCRIADWPRYRWRGWMIDSGRNFVETEYVKAILDQMAAYKMNLFHWHLTEYYGWRLESKRYPELQKDTSFYLRDIGRYYTQRDFREIVDYAWERGITVMPEFDVPGHALAFRRAFGYQTMRDEGIREKLCDLVDELCSLVPAERMPIVHLGTDEARRPEEKVPEKWMQPLIDRVEANGRRVIGWVPGELKNCTFTKPAIAMRWGRIKDFEVSSTATSSYIDGCACYVETFDPFELSAIATYRRTCPFDNGGEAEGLVACCWHDERTEGGYNVIRDQAMMPAITMLGDTFWCGRDEGHRPFHRRLPPANNPLLAKARDLEERVALQRDLVLGDSKLPFQFLRQTDLRWKVTVDGREVAKDVPQATVFLWQSDSAGVEGAGAGEGYRGGNFTTNRSGLAVLETWIRSPRTQSVGAWIGFTAYVRDHGRGLSGGTPPAGEWSLAGATVELNGEKLAPPALGSAGLKPSKGEVEFLSYVNALDEVPYTDEEWYMREPLPITLREGWNHVRLTIPCKWCGNQRGWVGTFIPLLGTTERPLEVPGLEYSSVARD